MSITESIAADIAEVAHDGYALQMTCHKLAKRAGWWNCPETGEDSTPEYVRTTLIPQKLLLIHSEISEACEAHRKNLMDDKLTHREGLEVELADAAIRIFDLAGALGFDLGAAMSEKLRYNTKRKDHTLEARRAAGGKAY